MVVISFKGQMPKDPSERVRRNAPRFNYVPIEWDGRVRGPRLPDQYSWCLPTQQWWEEFRRSPQAMVCVESDWQFLTDTALLHDRMWRDPLNLPVPHLTALSAEFRRRMSAYGYTFEDRQKQNIEITSPQIKAQKEAEIKEAIEQAVDYRKILFEESAKEE